MSMENDLHKWASYEQECLWDDLDKAIRRAINGTWSMQAASVALRLGRVARIIGPTGHRSVPWRLLAGGVYEALLDVLGIAAELPDEADWAELDRLMKDHGGQRGTLHAQYASTVATLRSPGEVAFIRDAA